MYALVYVFCMYLYACGKYGVSSRSSRARASYTVLTLSSVKFVSIFHDHSDSNLPRPVSLCPRGLGFHLGVRPIPRAFDVSSPFLPFPSPPSSTSRPISLSPPSSAPFSPVHPVLSQRCNVYLFSLSPAAWSPRITLREAKRTPSSALVTAETPELLQRRRGLVSAGWRLHGHRGWLHGPKGGPGQTVVVHITRRPRPADPYSRPVHRRRAA